MTKTDVSFIIPALNEASIIENTLRHVATFIDTNKKQLGITEVIVVAPGKDKTAKIAQSLSGLFERLEVIEPRRSGGKGADVGAGFAVARGDVQLFFDADLSTPLPHLLTMIKKLRTDTDVAIGARRLSKIHPGFVRTVVSLGTNLLTRPLLPRIKDTQCGCKGFTREAAQKLFAQQRSTGWGFDVELLLYAWHDKLRIAQIDIPDWREGRDEHLVGDHIALASLKTLGELARLYVRTLVWWADVHYVRTICIAMLAIVGLSLWINPFNSMWFDETYTAMLVKQPVSALIHLTSIDVHPPVYYLLLKGWATLFGSSDFALRSFSMLAGAAAGGVGLLLVRRVFGGKVMLGALPFVVFAPFLLRYDIEARMYALASLIGIAATYALVVAVKSKRLLHWALYGALVLLGTLTLYYLALVWLVHVVWCLWRERRAFMYLVAADVAAALLAVPWILISLPSLQHAGLWVGPPTFTDEYNLLSLLLAYTPVWTSTPLTVTLVGGTLALLAALTVFAWRAATKTQRTGIALLAVYFVLPIVLLTLASQPPLKPVFLYRYFAHTVIGAYLLIGVTAALVWRRWPKSVWPKLAALFMLATLIFGTFALHAISNENLDARRFPRAKETVQFLQSQHAGTIVADTPELYFELERYMPGNPNLYFYDGNYPVLPYGGLATLYGSPQQVQDLNSLHTTPIWFVRYTTKPKLQLPANRIITQVFQSDKYYVDIVR